MVPLTIIPSDTIGFFFPFFSCDLVLLTQKIWVKIKKALLPENTSYSIELKSETSFCPVRVSDSPKSGDDKGMISFKGVIDPGIIGLLLHSREKKKGTSGVQDLLQGFSYSLIKVKGKSQSNPSSIVNISGPSEIKILCRGP